MDSMSLETAIFTCPDWMTASFPVRTRLIPSCLSCSASPVTTALATSTTERCITVAVSATTFKASSELVMAAVLSRTNPATASSVLMGLMAAHLRMRLNVSSASFVSLMTARREVW